MFDIDNNWNIIENEHKVYSIDIEENFDEDNYEEPDNEISLAFHDLIKDFYHFLSDYTKRCLRVFWG